MDPATGTQLYDIFVLEQHIDPDIIRTQMANPFSSYSPNNMSVRAAIKAVADAAATMHVSNLVKQYNSRAERLFKATISHMNKKNTREFEELFHPMSIKGGGFVLLQPEHSSVVDTYIEKCVLPTQREGTGKRVRLMEFVEDDDATLRDRMMVPSLDLTQDRRISRQYRENRREVARHMQSTEAVLGGRDDFPAIPIAMQSYRIIAGSLQQTGGREWDYFAAQFSHIKQVSIVNIAAPNLINANLGMDHLPALIRPEDIQLIARRYTSIDALTRDRPAFVRELRRVAERRRAAYEVDVRRWIDTVPAAALVAPGAAVVAPFAGAGGWPAMNVDERRVVTFLTRFYAWSIEREDRYVLAWTPDAGFTDVLHPLPDVPGAMDLGTAVEFRRSVTAGNFTEADVVADFEGVQYPGFQNVPNDRAGVAVAGVIPLGWWNGRERLPTTTSDITEGPDRKRMVLLTGDLFDALQGTEYSSARATETDVDPSVGDVASPFAIRSGYRPQLLRRDNEVRYKLSLLPNRGFNPAYFGGSKEENSAANLGVSEDDVRRDFDESAKNWEFNLHVRSDEGYDAEWKATMLTVLQVLVTHANAGKIRPDVLPTLDVVNVSTSMPTGKGFIYVPFAPPALRDDPDYRARLTMPVRPVSQQQFANTYPRWLPARNDVGVSQAALFWYNNAVATATEPFSIRETGTNLDDVAAMIASAAPFAAMDPIDREMVATLHTAVCAASPFAGPAKKTLHLIQVTKASVALGNSNFAQPFPLKRIHFKAAALTDDPTTGGVRLEYTLGCEATVLVESLFVVAAMLKKFVMDDTAGAAPGGALAAVPAAGAGAEDVDDSQVPMVHTVGAMFPPPITDTAFKESIVHGPPVAPLGFTRSFFVSEAGDGVADLDAYVEFLGMKQTAQRHGLMNKSGRYLFGPAEAEPRPSAQSDSGPGYFAHIFTGADPVLGDPVAFSRAPLNAAAPPGGLAWSLATGATADPVFPGERWSSIVLRAGSLQPVPAGGGPAGGGPAGGVAFVAAANPTHNQDIARLLLTHRTTYEDYLAAEMLLNTTAAGVRIFDPQAVWDHNHVPGGAGMVARDHEVVSIPAYVYDEGAQDFMLLAWVHVGGHIRIRKENVPNIGYRIAADFTRSWVTGIYAVRENVLLRDPTTGYVRFSRDSVVLGLRLSDQLRDQQAVGTRYFSQLGTGHLPVGGRAPLESTTSFLMLRALADGMPLLKVDGAAWETSIRAFNRYRTHPRAASFTRREIKDISQTTIAEMLQKGCNGYHYSNSMSLAATVFAVAVNNMYDTLHDWYSERTNPLMPGEPLAVNVANPDPGDHNDARLVLMIQKEEMRGAGSGATSTTSGTVLVTPCVVEVRGPNPEALPTPCYIDNVFVKTANYRVYEAQLMSLLYQRISDIRSASVVRDRVRDCLGEYLERTRGVQTLRELVNYRPSTIPLLAMLMIQIKNYARISADTEKSRSNVAVRTAYKELMQDVHMVLFRA